MWLLRLLLAYGARHRCVADDGTMESKLLPIDRSIDPDAHVPGLEYQLILVDSGALIDGVSRWGPNRQPKESGHVGARPLAISR